MSIIKRSKKQTKIKPLYKKVYVIINPASGRDEPILNMLNDIFNNFGVEWDIFVTKKFGDAKKAAKYAVKHDYDLVVGYGGDGTQHELVNAIIGKKITMGILPGGTGNGFGKGLGIPRDTKKALEILMTSKKTLEVDVIKVGKTYCISRMYTGKEPEQQTSREEKNKYGMLAYTLNALNKSKAPESTTYNLLIDKIKVSTIATKCYVANTGSTGSGIKMGDFSPTDGLLDVFVVGRDLKSLASTAERVFEPKAGINTYYWRAKKVEIKPTKSEPVWIDGEYCGRTPVVAKVVPKAVTIVVPE